MAEPARARWTTDEFLAWDERQPDRHELVDGVPLRMMAGASEGHNDVVINIVSELRTRLRGKPCRPFNGDSAVETKPGQIRRPDAGVHCSPRQPSALMARDPRLVVEVLSPSTRDFDTYRKADEYKLVPGLARILLVDPNRPEVFMWNRDGAGEWESATVAGMEAVIDMPEIGIALPLAEIYLDIVFPAELRLVMGD